MKYSQLMTLVVFMAIGMNASLPIDDSKRIRRIRHLFHQEEENQVNQDAAIVENVDRHSGTGTGIKSFQLFISMYISPMSLLTNYVAWMTIESTGYEIMGPAFDELFEQVVLCGQVKPTVQILNTLVVNVNANINSPTQIRILVEDAIKQIQALLPHSSS